MRNNFCFVLVFVAILICSCQGLVRQQQIVGKFYLIAVDADEEMDVSYKVNEGSYVRIIPATVYSVGYNSQYLFAKQHPEGKNGKTNFYIVPLQVVDEFHVDEEVIGPLSEADFYNTISKLGVTEHKHLFQITLDDL